MIGTTVQPRPDTGPLTIVPIPNHPQPARGSRRTVAPLRAATLDEIDDVEWLLGWRTVDEIAAAVGRSSVAGLVRFLHRAERWDLAIRIMPIPLDPVDAYQSEQKLEEARWRVVGARADLIGWVIAWNATRPAGEHVARCAA